MAHKLSIINGKANMFYVGDKPWHGLGTRLEKAATSAEAIQAAGLNWEVEKQPVFLRNSTTAISRRHAVVRRDNGQPLGIVGDRYVPLQNNDAFRFFDAVVGLKEAIYHTAGALGQGEIIWILAKLNGVIRVVGDDITEKYLLLTNRHDGCGSVQILWTPIRVVCSNTLNVALEGIESSLHSSLRHTMNIGLRVEQVREALGIVSLKTEIFENAAKRLAQKQVTAAEWTTYLQHLGLAPKEEDGGISHAVKVMEEVSALFEKGRGNDMAGVKGTWWAGFNAVAEYVDYYRNPKGKVESRAKSLLFGSGAILKQKAWKEALSIVG